MCGMKAVSKRLRSSGCKRGSSQLDYRISVYHARRLFIPSEREKKRHWGITASCKAYRLTGDTPASQTEPIWMRTLPTARQPRAAVSEMPGHNFSNRSTTMPNEESERNNDDGIDHRGMLKCMAWVGTGLLWSLSGGV